VRAFGALGQAILSSMTIGIVGLGGIGSIVAEQLAHLGVGEFVLLDPDVLEETNLNRVVGAAREALGMPKVTLAEKLIRRINPDANVRAIRGDIMCARDASALLDVEFLFGCTDSHGSRTVLNQIAYQYMIPTIDLGVHVQARSGHIRTIAGRVQMLAPGLACLVCSNLLNSEEVRRDFLSVEARRRDPYIPGAAEPQPAVISLNGSVASFGVTMMLSAVVGIPLSARYQIIRFDRGTVRPVAQSPQENCIVCSLRGALGRGDLWPLPNRSC
jgi:molybdopterin-synthase adenylyltransferase